MRDAPDLAIYLRAPDGQPIRTADHCVGVFEAKEGDVLGRREVPLLAEKRKYVQTGTKAFYMCDQATVVAGIDRWTRGNRDKRFGQAHRDLDLACGAILGLAGAEVDWIIGQMTYDPFLSELRPIYAHRGFRQQPYSDRQGRNMYR